MVVNTAKYGTKTEKSTELSYGTKIFLVVLITAAAMYVMRDPIEPRGFEPRPGPVLDAPNSE